jgi:hypothetical protein
MFVLCVFVWLRVGVRSRTRLTGPGRTTTTVASTVALGATRSSSRDRASSSRGTDRTTPWTRRPVALRHSSIRTLSTTMRASTNSNNSNYHIQRRRTEEDKNHHQPMGTVVLMIMTMVVTTMMTTSNWTIHHRRLLDLLPLPYYYSH